MPLLEKETYRKPGATANTIDARAMHPVIYIENIL
jgi:hypothetical protein